MVCKSFTRCKSDEEREGDIKFHCELDYAYSNGLLLELLSQEQTVMTRDFYLCHHELMSHCDVITMGDVIHLC